MVTVPAPLTPGDYFLSAMADVLDTVAEESEVNNGLTAPASDDVVLVR